MYLILQVKKPDGSTAPLEIEAGAASVLNPLGFNKNSIAVGDVVTIVGNPARAKPDALMLGRDLNKQDGAYYPLFIGSRSVYAVKNESATTIAGTWFPPFTEFNAFGAARAKLAADRRGQGRDGQLRSQGHAAERLHPRRRAEPDVLPGRRHHHGPTRPRRDEG